MVIYLDHNATTPLDNSIGRIINTYSRFLYGNPSSPYQIGKISRAEVEKSREKVAKIINCRKNEVYFTSGGTASNNLAIQGLLSYFQKFGKTNTKKRIITTEIEHLSVLNIFKELSKGKNKDYDVVFLPVDKSGFVKLKEFKYSIDSNTVLISVMLANNEVGSIQPIKEMVKIAKSKNKNIVFHCDAVQGLGKVRIDVKDLGIDMLSISSHKIYGPKGVGALYIKKGTGIYPLFFGGHQEKGIRPGTENLVSIIAFGYACKLARENLERNIAVMTALKEFLKERLIRELSDIINIRINSPEKNCLPNTLNVCFKGIDSEILISLLSKQSVYVSSGSACTSDSLEPSHVLLAMGIPESLAHNAIRFSLGMENKKRDLIRTVKKIKKIILENNLNFNKTYNYSNKDINGTKNK